ncbi:lantibiotic dehydratase [Facklamia miroungae]|uniref:lantibiotic dehydratase n=1 Tax=Facklamia miroungae TaxID=120956 RepID=UPI001FDF674F|nr:lantibiotic dehydratase [Facklamia miroungae]
MYRATPYGTFSGIRNIEIDKKKSKNNIQIKNSKKDFSISSEYIFKIYNDICEMAEKFQSLNICLNPNIIITNNNLTLNIVGEHPFRREGETIYISNTGLTKEIIKKFQEKTANIYNLKTYLINSKELSEIESLNIIKDFLNERILYLEIYPNNFSTQHLEEIIFELNPKYMYFLKNQIY